MSFRSTLIAAVALVSLTAGLSAQTPAKVGVISIQGAIVGTKDGQKASTALDAKFAPKKKEFDARQSEVAQLQDQYNKSGAVMSEDKRNQMARDIDERRSVWSATCKTPKKTSAPNSRNCCKDWVAA